MTPLLRRWMILCVVAILTIFVYLNLSDLTDVHLDTSWPFSSQSSSQSSTSEEPALPKDFRWKDVPQRYPVASIIPLPTGTPQPIPRVQFGFPTEDPTHKEERLQRLAAVRKSFVHSWDGYKTHAWLKDEVLPISGGSQTTFGGWGATLVDSLDTLYIMGMKEDFESAVAALDNIDFRIPGDPTINVFETTIRYLGGLLSAHDVSGGEYPILLKKATALGDMLYTAFDTPNRMPVTRWDWLNGASENSTQEASNHALSAEIGSLTLEFTRLSQLTGDNKYYDAVQRISDEFASQQNHTKIPGLFPINVNAQQTAFTLERTFSFGGMADSLYEYFPKQYLMLGGLSDQPRNLYEGAIKAAKKLMFFRPMTPDNRDMLLSGTIRKTATDYVKLDPEGQHLACFTGGMVALGAKIFERPDDMETARKLVEGCIWAYESMPTGIMPETFRTVPCDDEACKWNKEKWISKIGETGHVQTSDGTTEQYIINKKLPLGFTEITDARYILRPEAIESIFVLYRITGDKSLQEKAWNMFQAVERATKTDISYAAVADVRETNGNHIDSCESFWTAETLKYFYLIFSEPDVISLDEFVFNTEAHPLRRPV